MEETHFRVSTNTMNFHNFHKHNESSKRESLSVLEDLKGHPGIQAVLSCNAEVHGKRTEFR